MDDWFIALMFICAALHYAIRHIIMCKSWSKPWDIELSITSPSSNTKIMFKEPVRYNTYNSKYQKFRNGDWSDLDHIQKRTPTCFEFIDYHKTQPVCMRINPYEWFSNPTNPTQAEITLFELEFGESKTYEGWCFMV